MKTLRDRPYIWVSWLSKLIAGESQCRWAGWFKAHYQYDKEADAAGFDLTKWTINHQQLLLARKEELEDNDFDVLIEDQNSFKYELPGTNITISGKADIVALIPNGVAGLLKKTSYIEDVKTGRCKASDQVQVMIYLIFLPKSIPVYNDLIFDGRVVYRNSIVEVPMSKVDDNLKALLFNTIKELGGDAEPQKCPSQNECKRCNIPKEYCSERKEK